MNSIPGRRQTETQDRMLVVLFFSKILLYVNVSDSQT